MLNYQRVSYGISMRIAPDTPDTKAGNWFDTEVFNDEVPPVVAIIYRKTIMG
jgi:hypothetical protein